MKRISALLLTLAMIFVLCACGNQSSKPAASATNDPSQSPAPTQTPTNTSGDAFLNAPLPTIQSKSLEISFGYSDANGDVTGTMVIIDDASPAVLYLASGADTYIYEMDDNDVITKYDKNEDGYTYSPNAVLTQDELRNEVDGLMNVFVLCGWNYTARYPQFRYQALNKDEDPSDYVNYVYVAAYTDDEDIWYKVFEGETVVALIAVDSQTGIFKYVESSAFRFNVLMYDAEGEIPVRYK